MENFTFHNVSINTDHRDVDAETLETTLHSTMFLLILLTAGTKTVTVTCFTFHNVSINTKLAWAISIHKSPLHSTMFLLIHPAAGITFEYSNYFTFHNVSINTTWQRSKKNRRTDLYIPQCFY